MIGFIAGAFDLLHPGHLHAMKEAKKKCTWLIVGLHVDPSKERGKKSPIQSVFERYAQLDACVYVDQIVPYQTEKDLLNLLATMDIDVRFLGQDYENGEKKITGKYLVPIKYISRLHDYSSSELRGRK